MYRIFVGILRILNSIIGWWWWSMEVTADWLVSFFAKSEYVRRGSCRRCGRCCRLVAMEAPRWIVRRAWLVRMIVWWHDIVLNFEFEGTSENLLVYRCRSFEEGVKISDTPRCGRYHFRPRLCRCYPSPRLYGHPSLHPECGFSFVHRDGRPSFAEILRTRLIK